MIELDTRSKVDRAGVGLVMDIRILTADEVTEAKPGDLPGLLTRDDCVTWVDIPACDEAAVEVLSEVFGLHPLAVLDCAERNRVPKLQAYADHALVVLHAPERGERGHVHYIELDLIIGPNFLVTAHGPVNRAVKPHVALRETQAVLKRIQCGRLRPRTPIELSSAIVSTLTRTQEDFLEAVTSDVWRLEQRVTGGEIGEPIEFLNELFSARHGLLAVRTMGALSREIFHRLAALPGLPSGGREPMTDLAEKFERVRNVADGEREYLQGVIEFYQTVLTIKATLLSQSQTEEVQHLTAASYEQNEEIKKISGWAAIFFAPTLVGTVYGMNFEGIPELGWSAGYPYALSLMVLSSIVLHRVFKRRGWL